MEDEDNSLYLKGAKGLVSLTGATLFLVLALWFRGLTDMRWRAAEVSRQVVE